MRIDIDDEIAAKCGLNEKEALELLAIAAYKHKGIHATLAGKLLGVTELEFHELLANKAEPVNYGMDDLIDDIKSNDR